MPEQEIANDEPRFLNEEYARLAQMSALIDSVNFKGANADSIDGARATIALLQERIAWLQTVSRRAIAN